MREACRRGMTRQFPFRWVYLRCPVHCDLALLALAAVVHPYVVSMACTRRRVLMHALPGEEHH